MSEQNVMVPIERDQQDSGVAEEERVDEVADVTMDVPSLENELAHSWLRLEDDDDSSIDLLTLSSCSDANQQSPDCNEGKIGLGDIVTGHKLIKRCWLINDNDQQSFDVKILLDWSKQIRVIVGEVCVDSTGLVLPQIDELPNRPQCIAQYKKLLKQALMPNGVSQIVSQESTGKTAELSTVQAPPDPAKLAKVTDNLVHVENSISGEALRDGIADVLEVPAAVIAPEASSTEAIPTAGAIAAAAVKSVRKLPTGAAKEKGSTLVGWAVSGSNLNPDTESDSLVAWEQLKDGGASGSSGGGAVGSSGNLGKVRRLTSGAKVSQSLSYLCGRQWGQDGVSAELCGAAWGADFDDINSDTGVELEMEVSRPFIGATSRAVKASRATKSFAKLNNMKPPVAEKKKKLPKEIVEFDTPDLPSLSCSTSFPSAVENSNLDREGNLVPVTDAFENVRRLRTADSRSASLVEDVEEALLSLVLKPSERVQVTFVVCPSPHYIDDATGGTVGGKLVDRDIPLILHWKSKIGLADTTEPDSKAVIAGQHRLALHFRTCSSVISIVPSTMSVYELGMCSVGEHRTVALEVRNDSNLPTVVFPFVESDVLDLSELEVRIPPQESRQIKVGFLAKTEDAEYWDKVIFLNGYNAEAYKEVRLKSRNVDTQQILLHTMFYKLVTYNNLRQLQVHFDRCLINMPNLRVFSIKNVHSKPLRLNVCWNAKSGIRLFLVVNMVSPSRDSSKSDFSSVANRSTKGSVDDLAGWLSQLGESDRVVEGEDSFKGTKMGTEKLRSASNSSSQQQDDIEDMKWGDDPHDLGKFGKYRRSMSMQAVKYLPAGGSNSAGGLSNIESHVGISGDDLSVNYGKGAMYEGKSGIANSSRDLLSVLDLSQSSLPAITPIPPVVSSNSSTSAESSSDEKGSASGTRRNNGESGGKEVRFKLLPSIGEHVESGVVTPQSLATPGSSRSNAPQDENVDAILRQFDNEEFPFGILDESDPTDNTPTNFVESRRNRSFFDDSGGADDLRKMALRPKERPHSIGGSSVSVGTAGLGAGGLGATSGIASEPSSREREKSEAEKRVKRVQKAYSDLRYLIDNAGDEEKSGLKELQADACPIFPARDNASSEVSVSVEIPVATSYRFALLYEPQQRADADDIEEYMQVEKSEEVHILLPDVNAADVSSSLNLNSILYDTSASHMPDDVPLHPHSLHDGGLRPRSLPIRASLVRSEMVVIQKNISFGRTVLGEKSSRGVTVVNRSSVPCLYTISKSGSISSGFLQVPGGRKGLIPAFSSKVIEFIFRPTLPGNFEEVLLINNVLNPRDTQTVTIKAKVSHTETFVISRIEPTADTASCPSQAEESFSEPSEAMYCSQLKDLLDSTVQASNVKSISCYLGSGVVGDAVGMNSNSDANSTCTQLCFRIKNVTSKPRQFIVDATHVHAVELLVVTAPPLSSPQTTDPKVQLFPELDPLHVLEADSTPATPAVLPPYSPSPHLISAEHATATPFEPIPEVLQSVLSLRCRFSSELVLNKSSSGVDGKDDSLSPDERKALEDSLEQFQQKLKIAIRKNKPEKIEKYQKKIDKVILSLQSNKKVSAIALPELSEIGVTDAESAAAASTSGRGDGALSVDAMTQEPPTDAPREIVPEPTASTSVTETTVPIANAAVLTSSATVAPNVGVLSSEESEVSYHFQLEPEQERIVRVTMSFFPGAGYRYWNGVLPFHGFLRIFECKNEDHVKIVRYGALIQSTRLALPAGLPAPVEGSSAHGEAGLQLLTERGESNGNISLPAVPVSAKVSPFLATVAQWSSLPTRDIYPKYRQLPQNLLPACIKLVRASKDRVMHGSLSIASLMELSGTLCLSIDEGFSAKVSSEYSTYNSKRHGSIHFAVTMTPQNSSGNSIVDDGKDSSAASSADDEITAGQQAVANCESATELTAGSKVDFSLQWRPPLDLGGGKATTVSSNGAMEGGVEDAAVSNSVSASLRIIGAVKVQLKIGDQIVGTSVSIPFIGVLEHTSVLAVSKYFTFEEVSVGSYRTAQIPIANTSSTEELHYIVSSEEVTPACKAMGMVDISGGQTGIIPPNSSKPLQLLFSASAAGKYEQKLWIRNIRDSFDQKRIVVQANVLLAQTKFVVFPDLETVSNSVGKYKPIDLGLVQIQSADGADAILPHLPPLEQRCFYELRIKNVSGKALCVTAVSNLKSQCFIYGDDNLSQLAIYCPLPASVVTTLYVVIRPAVVPSGSQLPSHSDVPLPVAEDTQAQVEPAVPDAKPKPTGGRDLVGGIKLVFFPAEHTSVPSTPRDESSGAESAVGGAVGDDELNAVKSPAAPFALDASPRKLFETAVSFRATVGKSTLTLKALDGSELQHIVESNHSSRQADYFVGQFELRNLSKLFPLEYAYILGPFEECVGVGEDKLMHQQQVISDFTVLPPPKKADMHIRILDKRINVLSPGESKWVSYVARYPLQASGVALYPVRVANTSTMEISSLALAVFLDTGKTKFQSVEELSSEKSGPANETVGDEHVAPSTWTDPIALPLKPILCKSAIWVYQHNYLKVNELVGASSVTKSTPSVGNAEVLPVARTSDDTAQDSAIPDPMPSSSVHFLVQGTSGGELCSWTYFNDKNKSITIFPASDLPISVALSTVPSEELTNRGEDNDGADLAVPRQTGASPTMLSMSGSASSAYSRKFSPALLRWKKSLKRCGGAFTIEAGSTVKVVVSARRGAALSEEQLAALGGTRRLEGGKGGQLQGVVVFLQASHSLQSLFDATPLKDKERTKENVANVTTAKAVGTGKDDAKASQESAVKVASTLKGKVGTNARSVIDILSDQIEILPIVNISTVSCTIAVPLLTMPEGDVSLGRKRCGQFTRFDFSVENQSEVDIPCCIDNLPAWMKIDRFHASLLNKRLGTSGENSVVADGDSNSMSTEPFLDLSASALDGHSHSEWSSPRRADIKSRKAEKNLEAQKLHWWLATNGATISSQQPLSPAFANSADRDRESENGSSRHRRGSRESVAASEVFSMGEGTGFSTIATEDGNHPSPFRTDGEYSDDRLLEHSSTEVDRARFLQHYQGEAYDLDLFKLHQLLARDTSDAVLSNIKLFAVPARSRIRITVVVQVPVLPESEHLQHSVRIKNLTTAVISPQQLAAGSISDASDRYLLDREGSVAVTDVKELAVRLQVDATRALELITAIDEPFVALTAPAEPGSRSSTYMRLLREPFLVPPPVEISLAPSNVSDEDNHPAEFTAANVPLKIDAKSKVSKTHCRFSVKNKLTSSLRVQATVTLNPEITELLDMKVKFQTNNSSVIDLEPEEACAVKIRVLPKLDGRMQDLFLSSPSFLVNTGLNDESKKKVVIQVEEVVASRSKESEKSAEITDNRSELKKTNSRVEVIGTDQIGREIAGGDPVLLGTVRISPSVSRPPSTLGWESGDNAVDEALHSQDTLILSIVGYLQPNSTVTTSLVIPTPTAAGATTGEVLSPPPVLEFKSITSEMPVGTTDGNESAPAVTPTRKAQLAAQSTTFSAMMTEESENAFSLIDPKIDVENRVLPPQPNKTANSNSSLSPMLALLNNGISFFISNPSEGRELNFSVETQTYRHAGMRLRLPGMTENDLGGEDAYDTFSLEATPSRGTLGPSSLSCVNLRLVPGDSSRAVKTSTTLTADIPDVSMRERRLRSHHGREHTSSSGTLLSTGSVSNSNMLPAATGIAGMSVPEIDTALPEGGIAVAAAEGEPMPPSKPVVGFNGPFTLACMPIEVWDCDFPNHPPKIIHAYLTCDVPLPVLVTQGLREAPRQKAPVSTNTQEIAVVLPSVQNPEVVVFAAADTHSAAQSDARRVQLHGEDQGNSREVEMCNLDVGQQVQRKEALEWPLLLENVSTTKSISYSILSVFPGDVDNWLSLGRSGGVLPPDSQTSLMIYFRRSVPPGAYVTYLVVENRECKSDSVVLRVSMEVVIDAKRASAISSMSSLPQLSSTSALSAGKRDRVSEDNLVALAQNSSIDSLGDNANPQSIPPPSPLIPFAATSSQADNSSLESSRIFPPISSSNDVSLAPTPPPPMLPIPSRPQKARPVFQLQTVNMNVTNREEAAEALPSVSPVGLSLSPTASPSSSSSGKSLNAPGPRKPPVVQRQRSDDLHDVSSVLLSNLTDVQLDLAVMCTLNYAADPPHLFVSSSGERDQELVGVILNVNSQTSGPRDVVTYALVVPPRENLRIRLRGQSDGSFLTLCDPVGGGEEDGADARECEGDYVGVLTFSCDRFENQVRKVSILRHSKF